MEVKKGAEKGEKGTVTLIGGRGDTLHNGRRLRKQEQVMDGFDCRVNQERLTNRGAAKCLGGRVLGTQLRQDGRKRRRTCGLPTFPPLPVPALRLSVFVDGIEATSPPTRRRPRRTPTHRSSPSYPSPAPTYRAPIVQVSCSFSSPDSGISDNPGTCLFFSCPRHATLRCNFGAAHGAGHPCAVRPSRNRGRAAPV